MLSLLHSPPFLLSLLHSLPCPPPFATRYVILLPLPETRLVLGPSKKMHRLVSAAKGLGVETEEALEELEVECPGVA